MLQQADEMAFEDAGVVEQNIPWEPNAEPFSCGAPCTLSSCFSVILINYISTAKSTLDRNACTMNT